MEATPSLPTQELASARIDYYKGLAIDSLAQTLRADRKTKVDKKLPSGELVQQAIMHGLDPFRALVDTKSSHALAAAAKLMVGLNEKIKIATREVGSGQRLSALLMQRNIALENMPPAKGIQALIDEAERARYEVPVESNQSPTRQEILADVREGIREEIADQVEEVTEEEHDSTSAAQRHKVEGEITPPDLIRERLAHQEAYLMRQREYFSLHTTDPSVRAMLYELNGGTLGFMEELDEVNSTLPPMSERAELSVIIPAYNEASKITKTLDDWVAQRELDGKKMDPEAIEFIILLNRPNESKEFDESAQIIEQLKEDPRYSGFNMHVIQKTFNFSSEERQITTPEGETMTVPKGVKMGLIYKYGADLAILRNMQRKDPLRKANHLMRTGSADVYGRSPEFFARDARRFDEIPLLDQHLLWSDYPHEFYRHVPLFHFAARVHEMLNAQLRRQSGLATYRASLYTEAFGFNPGVTIAEEVDLFKRMKPIMEARQEEDGVKRRLKSGDVQTLTDPRRAFSAVWSGIPLAYAYSNWEDESIRSLPLKEMLQMPVPPEASLTLENVNLQMKAELRVFLSNMLSVAKSPDVSWEDYTAQSYRTAIRYIKRALMVMGVTNVDLTYDGETEAGEFEKKLREDVRNRVRWGTIFDKTAIVVHDINDLEEAIRKYADKKDPKWMRQQEQDHTQDVSEEAHQGPQEAEEPAIAA